MAVMGGLKWLNPFSEEGRSSAAETMKVSPTPLGAIGNLGRLPFAIGGAAGGALLGMLLSGGQNQEQEAEQTTNVTPTVTQAPAPIITPAPTFNSYESAVNISNTETTNTTIFEGDDVNVSGSSNVWIGGSTRSAETITVPTTVQPIQQEAAQTTPTTADTISYLPMNVQPEQDQSAEQKSDMSMILILGVAALMFLPKILKGLKI